MTAGHTSSSDLRLEGKPSLAKSANIWLAAAILVSLTIQAGLVVLQPVNWDEFRFLADVHAYRRGELTAWLQTLHVQLFFWLPSLPLSEVDQVIVARVAVFLLELGTVFLIHRCARRFMEPTPALVAVLCYVAGSYVIRHGASFRFDPLAIFLLMASLALALERKRSRLAAAGVGAMTALAGLVTMKAIFFAPTIAIAAVCRPECTEDWRGSIRRLATIAVAGLLTFGLVAWLHASSLATETGAGPEMVAHGFRKTILEAGLVPRLDVLVRSLVSDPFVWTIILVGLGYALGDWRAGRQPRESLLILIGLALPLLSLLFYRNAFPYYYAMMLAPASILAGYAAMRMGRLRSGMALGIIFGTMSLHHGLNALSPILAVQRAHVEAVHEIFPEPVPYIDRASMIGSFPKKGFFMSSWGMENYLAAGRPVIRDVLVREAPLFVLVNSPVLKEALGLAPSAEQRLLDEDRAELRRNYIPHWGALWVAGKVLDATPAERRFELLIPGLYTFEGHRPVVLDGRLISPGTAVRLGRGMHRIGSPTGAQRVRLRIGRRLAAPAQAAQSLPLFGHL
ncbi:glycosyltransferase family 39 protein [Sphingosinicella sp. CPCC 101087]|uniref:glycosyltransferase family 39 protein n=1 Tax=Sphingosinicella sp. CPCC 101087 TaxID=2497754 RepID=UPI00101B945D|nr:glycosyltransferase family 39 protein [Sphingosinicella sp. CPCC 101087]